MMFIFMFNHHEMYSIDIFSLLLYINITIITINLEWHAGRVFSQANFIQDNHGNKL